MTPDERLLVALLALLPKGGERVTVRALATAAAVSQVTVTGILFDHWFTGRIGYDLRSDSYFAIPTPTTDHLPLEKS